MPLSYEDLKKDQLANPPQYDSQGMLIRRYTNPAPAAVAEPPVTPTPTTDTSADYTIKTPEQFAAERGGNVDETAIREQTRKNMQAMIDAINVEYANLVSEQERLNEGNMGKTRAVNARSGTLGSDFGNANMAGQEKANSAAVKAIRDEQAVKIAEVNGKIDEIARKEIEMKNTKAKDDAEAYAKYLDEQKTDARNTLQTLAESGTDLSTLDAKRKAYLFKAAGYDSVTGDLLYNAMKPKASQIDYKYIEQADGSILAIAPDPNNPTQFIQHRIEGAGPDIGIVIDMISKYPDAGISTTDDLATATAKIQQSRIYKEQVRPPQGPANADLDRLLQMLQIEKLQKEIAGGASLEEQTKKADKLSEIVSVANDMLADKKLGAAVGTLSSKLPTFRGGTADFERKYEQLRGLLTLDNIGLLKGVLSDSDMKIIKEASTKLNLNMSQEGFKTELQNIVDKASAGLNKLRGTSQSGTTSSGLNYTIEP